MNDTLERERLDNNLIDQLFALEERISRLEEALLGQASTDLVLIDPNSGARWRFMVEDPENGAGPGIVLEEL